MAFYKQSTAYTRTFFLVSSTDHITAKTGVTPTVNISKAGAAFGAAGGTVTEIANGWYKIVLTTTDTNTVGDLAYHITGTGADDTDFVDQVYARTLDDLAYPTTSGRSIDVTATGEVGIDWANIGSPTTTVNLSGTSTKAVEPTVAGRTLDVSATGEAGVDWANVGAPTTALNLSGTTISSSQVAASVTGAVGSVTGAVGSVTGNVGGNVTGSVGSVATGGIAAASFAAGAIDAAAIAADAIGASEIAADAIGSSELAATAATEIAAAVWDKVRSSHTTQGTFGESFNAIVSGSAITGTLTTTAMTTDLTEATDDHYNGRTVVWITGALAGQSTAITDYTGLTKTVTYTAVTEAPANTDKFIIV